MQGVKFEQFIGFIFDGISYLVRNAKPKVKGEIPTIGELEEKLKTINIQGDVAGANPIFATKLLPSSKIVQWEEEKAVPTVVPTVPPARAGGTRTVTPVTMTSFPEEVPETSESPEISTACLSCSRSHLSTVSGALGEALRFARGDSRGIKHPEVIRRVLMAEDEINMLERIDLAPDALVNTSPEDREVAEEYLPRIRQLRQNIGNISSVTDLEEAAAEASILGQEFRLRHLQLQGVDLNPVLELAKSVERGEITMDEAKEKIRELVPEEV